MTTKSTQKHKKGYKKLPVSLINKRIQSIEPNFSSSLIFEIFYFFLITTALILEHFSIFKFVKKKNF